MVFYVDGLVGKCEIDGKVILMWCRLYVLLLGIVDLF